jgi:hypothetical protein
LRARSTRAPFARVVPPAALARRRRIVRYIFHRVRARARRRVDRTSEARLEETDAVAPGAASRARDHRLVD